MAYYQFKASQSIPATKERVWDYISSPKNLKEITPPYMNLLELSEQLPIQLLSGDNLMKYLNSERLYWKRFLENK